MGLKVGLHTERGSIPEAAVTANSPVLGGDGATVDQLNVSKCGFGVFYAVDMKHPAGQAWLDSVYGQYAEWGLDFIKNDCIYGGMLEPIAPSGVTALDVVKGVRRAMTNSGRKFVYSLSPGGGNNLANAQAVAQVADMYRITGDWHDCKSRWRWDAGGMRPGPAGQMWNCTKNARLPSTVWGRPGLHEHFTNAVVTESMIGNGSYPDPDALTPYMNATDDQDFRLQMTFWAIQRAPLFTSLDMRSPEMTAEDFKLLTNRAVLAVNEASSQNRQLSATCDDPRGPMDPFFDIAVCKFVWAALAPDGGRYLALMNIGTSAQHVSVDLLELGVRRAEGCAVTDLWRGEKVEVIEGGRLVARDLPAVNGAELYHLQCAEDDRRAVKTDDSQGAARTVASVPSLATPVTVAVDSTRPGDAELPRFFQSTGFTPSAFLLTEQGRLNMLMAGGGGYKYMRVHCMLDLIDIQGRPGELRTNYSRLDEAFDAIVHAGLVPVVNIDGNPTGALHDLFMTQDFLNAQKVVAWRDMIEALGRHLVQRYGAATHEWAFEHWNEPMVIDKFCVDGKKTTAFGSFQSMFNYYDACENGLARADPGLRIGGPSTHSFDKPDGGLLGGSSSSHNDPFVPFLEHCDTGTNYFSNRTGTRLDFISIHRKGSYKGAPGGGNATNILAVERAFFRVIREKHSKFLNLPFWNDEADPISGWAKFLSWRPGPIYAAFMVSAISQHAVAFESSSDGRSRIDGVPYALISNDNSFTGCVQMNGGYGDSFTCDPEAQPQPTWLQRTLLTTFTSVESDGENRTRVIKKPDLTVMSLLNRLGARRAPVKIADGAAAKLGGMAALGKVCTAVMLYRSDDTAMTDEAPIEVSLDISGLPQDVTTAVHWRLDDLHGNPYKVWTDSGSPAWPTDAQMKAMEAHQEPVLLEQQAVSRSAEPRIAVQLPLPAVSLVQLCAQPAQGPAALPQPTLMSIQGDTATAVSWAASPASETVRTYIVEHSRDGETYARVNEADVISAVWIHRLAATDAAGAKRCYRVRAADYWNRTSAVSKAACLAAAGRAAKTDDGAGSAALRPSWPANYAMNASVYSGYLNAAYLRQADEAEAAAIARHGLITLSWMQDICHNTRNTTPPSCRYAHADDSLRQQAAALRRLNPSARVLIYRNCALGLSSYGEQCKKMYDKQQAAWWLRAGDTPSGAILNDGIDPTQGARADRAAFNCSPGGPGLHLMDQYLWDYRRPDAQQFLVDDLKGLAAGADGIWLDDTHAVRLLTSLLLPLFCAAAELPAASQFNEHAALEKGYSAASVAAIQTGLESAAEKAQAELAAMGKWVYHFENNVMIPLVQGDKPTCIKSLLAANVTGATQHMFGTMQLPTFLAKETSANHNFLQNLAAFLLTRGDYSFFGAVGPGDAAVFDPPSGSRWFAEYDMDYGVPVGGMRLVAPGVYAREWSRLTVQLDCNKFAASFQWKQRMN